LGLAPEDVEVSDVDTRLVPDSGPTVASRTCMIVGGCVQRACSELVRRVEENQGREGSFSERAAACARALGERAAAELARESVILRPSVLFGPGDAFLTTLERITRMLPVVPLFGTGDTRLQPVYVDDVAVAVTHALTGAAAGGEIYELGGPQAYRYRDLISLVLAHLQRKRVLLPVPFPVWELQSACLSLLPDPPLTRDQIILTRNDNVVGEDARNFADLGIEYYRYVG